VGADGEEPEERGGDSGQPFLFTLKALRDSAWQQSPLRFEPKPEEMDTAIFCDSNSGPSFRDISVSDKCDTNTNSSAFFGRNHDNFSKRGPDAIVLELVSCQSEGNLSVRNYGRLCGRV
jgi:hypothetical protein